MTLAVRSYWETPVPRVLVEKYGAHSKEDLLEVLVGTKVEAFERNAEIYFKKSKWWRTAVIFLAAALAAALTGGGIAQWEVTHG